MVVTPVGSDVSLSLYVFGGVSFSYSCSATWPSGTARRLQIQRDEFDSRLELIAFDLHWMVADLKSASSLRSLSSLPLNFEFNVV